MNATNDFGVTPLALACTNANSQIVQALLQAGADANSSRPTGESVLMTCSRTGSAEAVRALLQHGAAVNAAEHDHHQTALMWAAAENHPEVIADLMKAGADVNAHTEVRQGVRVTGYRQALPESVGFSAVLFAARAGARESIEVLLAHGANVNETSSDGTGVLQTAMSTGHWDLVPYLLDRGADPDADGPGYTPMHWASGSWEALLSGVFLERLRTTPDGDGTLLDHSVLLYGSGISNGNTHSHVDVPVVMMGGGGGRIKGGQYVRYTDVPLANLHRNVFEMFNVPLNGQWGDSTGRLDSVIT
ncbi:MAG: ankyrin repeat domain-containing protein [Acidobacteria bacterium]|nr:ankyrin repeat domain-containing protein [Acidobacteriota bacterium]